MVPMVETAEMATGIVRATRYPPHGIRGVGSAIGRASRWNRRAGYLQKASEEICVVVQLETVAAIKNLHAIAQVEGVDGIFWGLRISPQTWDTSAMRNIVMFRC